MRLSVVIRSRDEADRLRLTLASLARQTAPAEVVVVDDGSADHTAQVLDEARAWLPLTVVGHAVARGRSGAANAGAEAASGEILLFLDGDTLAAPDLVERHLAAHAEASGRIGRGETWHLRGVRLLRDPETGAARPEHAERLAAVPADELARLRVTRAQIADDFAGVHRRAEPGVYPGFGPRRLYELEMEALRLHPDCSVLWAAASGSNLSVGRAAFFRAGGFDAALDINEHRELALRLCQQGGRMAAVEGARSYHLIHRTGWRDPLAERGWEDVLRRRHPTVAAVPLLVVLWAGLSPRCKLAPELRIDSLPALEAAARGDDGVDYEAARRLIFASVAAEQGSGG